MLCCASQGRRICIFILSAHQSVLLQDCCIYVGYIWLLPCSGSHAWYRYRMYDSTAAVRVLIAVVYPWSGGASQVQQTCINLYSSTYLLAFWASRKTQRYRGIYTAPDPLRPQPNKPKPAFQPHHTDSNVPTPSALGTSGCSCSCWKSHADSRDSTEPRPRGWLRNLSRWIRRHSRCWSHGVHPCRKYFILSLLRSSATATAVACTSACCAGWCSVSSASPEPRTCTTAWKNKLRRPVVGGHRVCVEKQSVRVWQQPSWHFWTAHSKQPLTQEARIKRQKQRETYVG